MYPLYYYIIRSLLQAELAESKRYWGFPFKLLLRVVSHVIDTSYHKPNFLSSNQLYGIKINCAVQYLDARRVLRQSKRLVQWMLGEARIAGTRYHQMMGYSAKLLFRWIWMRCKMTARENKGGMWDSQWELLPCEWITFNRWNHFNSSRVMITWWNYACILKIIMKQMN